MHRNDDHRDDLIDLGAVSQETKGIGGTQNDVLAGQKLAGDGLTDD